MRLQEVSVSFWVSTKRYNYYNIYIFFLRRTKSFFQRKVLVLCAGRCPYSGTCATATHLAYFSLSLLCYAGCHRWQWFIILVVAHIWSGRALESASYIKGMEYSEYFLIFITKPRIYFSPNGGECAKKDGLNEFTLLRLYLWVECIMPACLSFFVHAFLSVQWHTCPANLWIWYIV